MIDQAYHDFVKDLQDKENRGEISQETADKAFKAYVKMEGEASRYNKRPYAVWKGLKAYSEQCAISEALQASL